jgi:hypothetical protein
MRSRQARRVKRLKVSPVHNGKATTAASGEGFAEVGVARGTGFIETREDIWLWSGLN